MATNTDLSALPPPEGHVTSRPAWWRRRGIVTTGAVLTAFVLGVAAGPGAGEDRRELETTQAELAVLEAEVDDLERLLADQEDPSLAAGAVVEEIDDGSESDGQREIDALNERISTLDDEIADFERQADSLQAELDGVETDAEALELLEERETELEGLLAAAEKELEAAGDLDAREQSLEAREQQLAEQVEDPVPASEPEPSTAQDASGCQDGQVDINAAGSSELQRIHQVGPDRAGQIIAMRPFSSVGSLTRVSGIGDAHLSAIQGQGLACVR